MQLVFKRASGLSAIILKIMSLPDFLTLCILSVEISQSTNESSVTSDYQANILHAQQVICTVTHDQKSI